MHQQAHSVALVAADEQRHGVALPTAPIGFLEVVAFEHRQELLAWHRLGPQRGQMVCGLLCVDKAESVGCGEVNHPCKGHLRGVALGVEHRLSAEEVAQAHAIESADQLAVKEGLERVGKAIFVQAAVGFDKVAANPAACRLARSLNGCAALHHLAEAGIDAHLETF